MVRHRRVRPSSDDNPAVYQRPRREHHVSPMSSVVGNVAIAELPEKCGLHGWHDALFNNPVLQIRRQDAAMVNPMPQSLAWELGLGALHRIQRLLNGAVAHGMDRALPASPVRPAEQVVEVFLLPVGDTVTGGV